MKTIRRNHTGHRVGEDHQRARLTDAQVREMRCLHTRSRAPLGYRALAKRYDCGMSTARDICKYRTRASA